MFFRQILHDDLGCASYVVADGGNAAVIDPKWEIEDYLTLAEEHGFQIGHVLETHNHADHVSGHGRLHAATGAALHISAQAGVAYEHEPLADGDTIELGDVLITALATPGHRPEHMAYTVADRSPTLYSSPRRSGTRTRTDGRTRRWSGSATAISTRARRARLQRHSIGTLRRSLRSLARDVRGM